MIKSNVISLVELEAGDINAWADFAWHYSPELFADRFASVGLLIEDDKDVDRLVTM